MSNPKIRMIEFPVFHFHISTFSHFHICWILSIICLAACGPKNGKPKTQLGLQDSLKFIIKPDTALIELKSFKTVAINDLISQNWNMDDVDAKYWNEFFWDTINNKRKYPGLSLFRDFSFTENPRTDIKTGKWGVDKVHRLLLLTFADGQKKSYYVQQLSFSAMVFGFKMKEDSVSIKFSADNLVHKKPEDDPFYSGNNKWRIKPLSAETNEQIRQRVKNCVRFYLLFFKDNWQRQQTDISYIGLPSCFEWYNGGISLQKPIELDKKWVNCFYSEDQAFHGYDMLKTLMETQELKWPDRKNGWVFQIQFVLDQMYNKL